MQSRTRFIALGLACAALAACSHKDKDAPLAFVPADTPYVAANLAVLDDEAPARAQAVDLVPLLEQALASAGDTAAARGLELSLDAPDALPAVLPLAAWQSVLHNLLDNALRYVPSGGRIEVALRPVADGLELRVADDGPGLPPEWRERAFDRFWRAPGQQVSGSGLGLSIVQQAARRLGGRIAVEDGLGGRGIAFVLYVAKSA